MVEQLPVLVKLPGCGRRAALAKSHGPYIGRTPWRAVPSQDALRILLEQHLKGLGRETPVVARKGVDVKIEGTANKQNAVRPEHAMDFLEAAPEARHMLERTHGDDCAESALGERQGLDIRNLVHPWSRARVDAEIIFTRKERP